MSMYCSVKTEFKVPEALISALMDYGFRREEIEVHEDAVPLFGYQNDQRPQKAHIVIRSKYVGPASNDVGWERQEDGTYQAWISEYDKRTRFNQKTQNRIKQDYAFHAVRLQQEKKGRRVERMHTQNGRQRVVISGYR